MGWRVSYYQADKQQPLNRMTDEDGYEEVTINGKVVLSESGTEFWLDLKNDEQFKKEITMLKEHEDNDYYSITKEGFKRIILAYRQRIIEYHRQALENEENPELINKDYNRCRQTPKQLIQEELKEWEASYKNELNGETMYFNISLTDRNNLVSSSWKYKYAIFDMIHILKTFDWEKYTMVVFGG